MTGIPEIDEDYDGGPVDVPPPYRLAAQAVRPIIDACAARDVPAIEAITGPILAEHGLTGRHALCLAMTAAFTHLSGLDGTVQGMPPGSSNIVRMDFLDMPNLFGGTEFDHRARLHTARDFVSYYLSEADTVAPLEGDDCNVTAQGLCELIAAGTAPPPANQDR